jgi:hypothetical protein
MTDGLAAVRQTLRALQRLMDGEDLTVADVRGDGPGETAAVRSRLRALAQEVRRVEADEPVRGRAQRFRWSWPTKERSTASVVRGLAAARAMLHPFVEGEIGQVLGGLFEDHLGRIPEAEAAVRLPGDRMFHSLAHGMAPLDLDVDTLDEVARAVSSCRVIQGTYSSIEGRSRSVKYQPWTILLSDSGVHLYGLCLDDEIADHVKTRRVLSVSRLSGVRRLDETFAYPLRTEYDPEALFDHCFGLFVPAPGQEPAVVVLRFTGKLAGYVGRHGVHRCQTEVSGAGPDGSVEVRLRLHITYDFVRWVRGHGTEVQVLEPEVLQTWVTSGEGGGAYGRLILGAST